MACLGGRLATLFLEHDRALYFAVYALAARTQHQSCRLMKMVFVFAGICPHRVAHVSDLDHAGPIASCPLTVAILPSGWKCEVFLICETIVGGILQLWSFEGLQVPVCLMILQKVPVVAWYLSAKESAQGNKRGHGC